VCTASACGPSIRVYMPLASLRPSAGGTFVFVTGVLAASGSGSRLS
jgi:hypothetical protein